MSENTAPTGGYLSANSAFNLAEGGYRSLREIVDADQPAYPTCIGTDLAPLEIESIESVGTKLITLMKTESGAGMAATGDHLVLRAIPEFDEDDNQNGWNMRNTALDNLEVGDMLVLNPRTTEEGALQFDLSPVESVVPYGLEEAYRVRIDRPDNAMLINGLITVVWGLEN